MTLPTSGPIAFSDINIELGLAGTTSANINQASYRTLAGIPSGAISLASFYGKSNLFVYTINGNASNVDLRAAAVAAGWNQAAKLQVVINGGIISSTSTSAYALTIAGSFPQGITLTNRGSIVGRGGAGGTNFGGFNSPGDPGAGGGPAILVQVPATIDNSASTIGGGGGGGGAAGSPSPAASYFVQSGGGGGGAGYGSGGQSGYYAYGQDGTLTTGGAGGVGYAGKTGGVGGGLGSVGGTGQQGDNAGASGGAGGAAGYSIVGYGYVTLVGGGSILGPTA